MSSQPQWLALDREATSARNLVRAGIESVVGIRMLAWDLDPALTMLSIGVEKMIKLTIGVVGLREDGQWRLRRGHDLVPMHATMMAELRRIAAQEDRPGILAELDQVDGLLAWQPLLGVLHNYAMSGRFVDLDSLAGTTQPYDRPQDMWDENVEFPVCQADPSLWEEIRSGGGRERLNEAIAQDIRCWHGVVYGCWRIGMLGELAHRLSFDLNIRQS